MYRLELEKGFQILAGPFHELENLMDAITFILGVSTSRLIDVFDGNEKDQKGRKAFVRLIYQLAATGSELHFTREITDSDDSEYRIDGAEVTWKEYNAKLRSLGILVEPSNFLGFQQPELRKQIMTRINSNIKKSDKELAITEKGRKIHKEVMKKLQKDTADLEDVQAKGLKSGGKLKLDDTELGEYFRKQQHADVEAQKNLEENLQ